MKASTIIIIFALIIFAFILIDKFLWNHKPITFVQVNNDSLAIIKKQKDKTIDSLLTINKESLQIIENNKVQIDILKNKVYDLHKKINDLNKHDFRLYQDSIWTNRYNLQ